MKDIIVKGNIHAMKGRAGWIYLAGEAGQLMLVDSGFPSDATKLFAYIKSLPGGKPEWIKLAVLTHSHFDHVSGVDKVVKESGCGVAASIKAEEYLAGRKAIPMASFYSYLKFGWFMITNCFPGPSFTDWFTMPYAGIPGIKKGIKAGATYQLEEGQTIPVFPEWKLIYTPGHTDDGICLYNAALKTMFSGDTIINDKGKIKLNPLLTLDKTALNESLKTLKQYEVDYLCPGWGPPKEGNNILAGIEALV